MIADIESERERRHDDTRDAPNNNDGKRMRVYNTRRARGRGLCKSSKNVYIHACAHHKHNLSTHSGFASAPGLSDMKTVGYEEVDWEWMGQHERRH